MMIHHRVSVHGIGICDARTCTVRRYSTVYLYGTSTIRLNDDRGGVVFLFLLPLYFPLWDVVGVE